MTESHSEVPASAPPLRVLIVEDSERDTELLVYELERGGYDVQYERVETADSMRRALERQPWDIVLSDNSILQFDALSALELARSTGHDVPFVIVSGTIGEERAVQVMKAGASDYVDKSRLGRLIPVVARELADAQQRREREAAEAASREREQQALLELADAYETTLEGWARALDLRHHETEGHSRRVTELTLRLARRMGLGETACIHIRRGALLHDIGKMGIPDRILLKPAALTDEEWEVMRRHPLYARDFLAPIDFLTPALDIPYSHHEKWDGTGYPQGLRADAIPLAARIFAVVDIWDALRSDRPYRKALSFDQVCDHLVRLRATHLDPDVADAFLDLCSTGEVDRVEQETGPGAARILLVEDIIPDLMRRWLSLSGYQVRAAATGADALAALAGERFDLVLLDVTMPDLDGLTLCRMLKQAPATRDLSVIVMSGHDRLQTEARALELGADDFLAKPVDGYELRARVRRALERARQRREGGAVEAE